MCTNYYLKGRHLLGFGIKFDDKKAIAFGVDNNKSFIALGPKKGDTYFMEYFCLDGKGKKSWTWEMTKKTDAKLGYELDCWYEDKWGKGRFTLNQKDNSGGKFQFGPKKESGPEIMSDSFSSNNSQVSN